MNRRSGRVKAVQLPKPSTARNDIGLTAAERGDLQGLYLFMSFVRDELRSLHKMPPVIREVADDLATALDRSRNLVMGFHIGRKGRKTK